MRKVHLPFFFTAAACILGLALPFQAKGQCGESLTPEGLTLSIETDPFNPLGFYSGRYSVDLGDGCGFRNFTVTIWPEHPDGVQLLFIAGVRSTCTLIPGCGNPITTGRVFSIIVRPDTETALAELQTVISDAMGVDITIELSGEVGVDENLCLTISCILDSDGDGVLDADDACDGTAPGDVVDANGCSVTQYCPCDGDYKNHGQYVKCIVQISKAFLGFGLITKAEQSAIVSAAAQSGCGK